MDTPTTLKIKMRAEVKGLWRLTLATILLRLGWKGTAYRIVNRDGGIHIRIQTGPNPYDKP